MRRSPCDAVPKQNTSVGEFELRLDDNTLWLGLVFACNWGEWCRNSAVERCSSAPLMLIFCGSTKGRSICRLSYLHKSGTHTSKSIDKEKVMNWFHSVRNATGCYASNYSMYTDPLLLLYHSLISPKTFDVSLTFAIAPLHLFQK